MTKNKNRILHSTYRHRKRFFIVILFFSCLSIFGNTVQDSTEYTNSADKEDIIIEKTKSFSYTKYIIPTALITYGIVTQFSEPLQNFDHSIHEKIKNKVSKKYAFDDYLQYASPVAMYALNLSGVKSKHNLRDQTIILASTTLLTTITVQATKLTTKIPRPDGGTNAFPSGHTATAFAGAHILYKEYKDISPWIGIGGYLSATTVGAFRMINKRHWFSDVITGAGTGILCVEVSYLMLPVYHRLFGIDSNRKRNETVMVIPLIGRDFYGGGLAWRF